MFEQDEVAADEARMAYKKTGSGSHECCVPGCLDAGTTVLGITRASPSTQWHCTFHAWNRPVVRGPDWRDVLVNEWIKYPGGHHGTAT